MYTPENINVFLAAFCGTYTAITDGERPIQSTDPAHYLAQANTALAVAEEFDTVWAGASADAYEVPAIQMGCYGFYLNRPPTSDTPTVYASDCSAIRAMVLEGEAVLAAAGIVPPPFGTSAPLVRTRWVDGDTTTPAGSATGAEGAPFKSVSKWATAIGVGSSAADSQALELCLVSPSQTGYTDAIAFPAYRNVEVRCESELQLTSGALTWHNSVAGGGTHPPSSFASVKLTNFTGASFTCTDDGTVTGILLLENNDFGPEEVVVPTIDLTGCTALGAVEARGLVFFGVTSTANGTGAIVEFSENASLGNSTCQLLSGSDSTLSGTLYTVADGSSNVLTRCVFSNGGVTLASATAAGATFTMDPLSYKSFLELGGVLSHIVLLITPTPGFLAAPLTIPAGTTVTMVHGQVNNFEPDMTAAAVTFNLDPTPTQGQLFRVKNPGVGATGVKINATGGFNIEEYGNQGVYAGANGQSVFNGQGASVIYEFSGTAWEILASA